MELKLNISKPGWVVRGKAGYAGHGVNDANGRSVCAVPSNGNLPYEVRNANVAMLAAAPDMYDALQALLDVTCLYAPAERVVDAMAALAKARGE